MAGFIVQIILLLGILVLTPASLELDLDSAAPIGLVRLLLVVVAIGVVVGSCCCRRAVVAAAASSAGSASSLGEALGAVRGLRSPRRLGMLFGGNLASERALRLGPRRVRSRRSASRSASTELILINISVSLLAGLLPIPGGIGVVEGGLTFGLVRAGMPEETALAAVLMYRLSTFYLPPIWGFFALKLARAQQAPLTARPDAPSRRPEALG